VMAVMLPDGAQAQMPRVPDSSIDPAVFRIDEFKFLGARPDPSTHLVDEQGNAFTLSDKLGVPVILVLSYFNCDGTCSVVNNDLVKLLESQKAWKIGKDFRVLTVSFDPHDSFKTMADFRKRLEMPAEWTQGWTLALPNQPDETRRLADAVGFKYFWSSPDRSFLHPGVFVFLSPEGRVVRYLYSNQTRSFDIGLALTDALGEKVTPSDILNYAVSICYSYNYKDGRYKLNIPAFVGMASLIFGITLFIISVVVYRRRTKGE